MIAVTVKWPSIRMSLVVDDLALQAVGCEGIWGLAGLGGVLAVLQHTGMLKRPSL